MQLNEIFNDTNQEWEITDGEYVKKASTFFKGKKVEIVLTQDDDKDGSWDVVFTVNDSTRLTGGGDEIRIFAMVVEGMRRLIGEVEGVHRLHATAKEENRAKLYIRMFKRLLPQWETIKLKTVNGTGYYVAAMDGGLEAFTTEDHNSIYLSLGDENVGFMTDGVTISPLESNSNYPGLYSELGSEMIGFITKLIKDHIPKSSNILTIPCNDSHQAYELGKVVKSIYPDWTTTTTDISGGFSDDAGQLLIACKGDLTDHISTTVDESFIKLGYYRVGLRLIGGNLNPLTGNDYFPSLYYDLGDVMTQIVDNMVEIYNSKYDGGAHRMFASVSRSDVELNDFIEGIQDNYEDTYDEDEYN